MDLGLGLEDVGRERARLRASISWRRSVFLSREGLPIIVGDKLKKRIREGEGRQDCDERIGGFKGSCFD